MSSKKISHIRSDSNLKDMAAHSVRLLEKFQEVEGTLTYVFERPNGFKYTAGQHVIMHLPKHQQGRIKNTPNEECIFSSGAWGQNRTGDARIF